jgi:hypothetical protein
MRGRRRPPRLRTVDDGQERHASSLEMFFDLVFVVAVVWLAVEIPRAFDNANGGAGFAVACAAVRAILVALYLRAHHHEPRARPLTRRYITGFTMGAALWLASAFVTSPARHVLWGIAIVIELTPPLLSSEPFRRVPFHVSHILERFSLFTIIALGETVVLVATGMAAGHLPIEAVLAAVCGFVIAADRGDGRGLPAGRRRKQSPLHRLQRVEARADQAAIEIAGPHVFVSSQPQYSILWQAPEVEVFPLCAVNHISTPTPQASSSLRHADGDRRGTRRGARQAADARRIRPDGHHPSNGTYERLTPTRTVARAEKAERTWNTPASDPRACASAGSRWAA